MEDEPGLVLDIGSRTLRAGFIGDDAPRAVIPSVIGRPKYDSAMVGHGNETKSEFIGTRAISMRGVLQLTYPVDRGVVTNWGDLEKLWHHTFYNELQVDPTDLPIIITEPPLNPRAVRERYAQILFDTFNAAAIYFGNAGVLSMYASGRNTAVIVDVGATVTQTIPIRGGYTIVHAIQRLNLGGSDITEYLTRLLKERGYNFYSSSERNIVKRIKEEVCYVAENYAEELENSLESNSCETTYELPDGNVITIGNERFRAAEMLFDPSMIGSESPGLADIILKTFEGCPIDDLWVYYSNVVLSGGGTLIEGIGSRLVKDLSAKISKRKYIRVVEPPERRYSPWIGGSILASISTFQPMWLAREDFEDDGPEIVHDYCIV